MTTTLTKPRTASIIVDTDGDGFKIQHMLFMGDSLDAEDNYDFPTAWTASTVSQYIINLIRWGNNRPTSVFITISAAKRMTNEQIAAIQQAALETRT